MGLRSKLNKCVAIANDQITRLRAACSRSLRGIRIDSPPVFIVGCGHSGTSIILAILGAHTRLFAVPYESRCAMTDDHAAFQQAMRRFDRLAEAAGKRRWIEKTPRHIQRIGQILRWQPEAKVLLILRDGRDVARSIQARTGSAEQGIQRWIDDNEASRPYWDHPNVLRFKYEDLVTDFEPTVRRILAHIGEPYQAEMRSYHTKPKRWYAKTIRKPNSTKEGAAHNEHRNWQINQPLFDGRGRWKELSSEDLQRVTQIGGDLLAELGYREPDDQTNASPQIDTSVSSNDSQAPIA